MDSRDEFPQLPRGASHHYKIFCGFQKSISSAGGYDCNALPARSHQFQFGFCSPAASVGAFTWEGVGSIHELLELCTTTGFNRLRKYRIIKYSVEEDNELVEWQWYWYIFLKNILYFGHVEIAVNRLSAVVLTRRYDSLQTVRSNDINPLNFYSLCRINRGYREVGMVWSEDSFNSHKSKFFDKNDFLRRIAPFTGLLWNTKNIIFMTILGYIISASLRAAIYSPDLMFTTYIFPGSDLFSFVQTEPTFTFENSTDIVLSFISAVICALCYSITVILQRKHSNMDAITKKQESILLKIGMLTFLIILPATIRSGLELWARVTAQEAFLSFIIQWNMLPTEATCVFQPWLLLVSCRSLRTSMLYGATKVSRTKIAPQFQRS